jgi:DNA-binding LytR/AlgR family response regulator
MKLTIAVCEDETIALKINSTYINELSKKYRLTTNVLCFTNGESLLEYVEKEEVDIIFMDIDLKGMNGIQTASAIMKKNPKTITIFITGHREFAYDAFTVEAFSFLTKPIDPERLERVFKKAILQANYINKQKSQTPIIITEDNIKKKINQSNIIYIERIDTLTAIVTKVSKHNVYETITSLAARLEVNFVRINQGIIVNLEEVEEIKLGKLIMKTGEIFMIGRTYSKEVKRLYLEYPQA